MAITPASLEETKRNLQTEKKEPEEKEREKEKGKKAEESAEITLEEEELYQKGVTTVRDLIAPSSLRVTPYYLQLGNQYLRTIFVVGFPRYIYVGWFSPVMHLNIAMDIAMFFYPVPSKAVLKQLQKRVGNIEAEIIAGQEKGAPRDPLKETALRDIEKLRDDLTTGVEHFFQFGLYVTIYASSEKELERFTEQVESIFGSKLVYTRHSFYQSEQGFNSTLPLGIDELMVLNNLNTSPCASSFPFISADLTSDNGILYGINRHNNSLILFDRFSMPNANMTVFATSGAGKSISKDETVLIKNKGKVQLAKIGPLVEKMIRKYGAKQIDEEMEGVVDPGIEVWSFDKNLKGEWSKVTVAARKKAPKNLYRFITRSGRSITTTGDHNMLVLKNGKIIAAKSREVKEGDYIPLPNKISDSKDAIKYFNLFDLLKSCSKIYLDGAQDFLDKNYNLLKKAKINPKYDRYLYKYRQERRIPIIYFRQILEHLKIDLPKRLAQSIRICSCRHKDKERTALPILFPITPELLRLLGYIVSEGTVGKDFVLITNQDIEVQTDIKKCLEKLNIAYYIRAQKTFALTGRVFVELIKALGVTGKSVEKKVPSFIFSLSNPRIAEFIKAYFEGDGGVEKNGVTAASKSRQLVSEISYLFYRFGIVTRISKIKKRSANWKHGKTYYKLVISGQENLKRFAKNINFVSQRKQEMLSHLIKRRGNTNVNIVPEVRNIFEEIYKLFSAQLHGIQEISAIKNGVYNPSPEQLRAVQPRSVNVFKAIKVTNGVSYSLRDIKKTIHCGFKEMDLPIRYYNNNSSLQYALVGSPKSNTRYTMIQQSAEFIWQNYQKMLVRISKVEEKLAQLKTLANSDLFWDPIVEIKRIKNKDKYVYDLTVDNEVFLAGEGGVFVHNSYAIKLEILRSLMQGTDVIVIDPEKEYKYLSDAVGGTYINISLNSESKLNPFDLPRMESKEERVSDIVRSAVISLKGLLKIMIGIPDEKGVPRFTPAEDSLLDRALLETYAKRDIMPGCNLEKVKMPVMSDLVEVLEGMEGGEDLAQRLKKYTEGTFAGLLNQPTNVKIDNQLVVFSVRDLEDELRPIAIYTIINYIWNVVRSEMKKRILIIDEAWWLMQHEDSAKFIFTLVKRCRKYYLGVTTITQDVNDFLLSPYGKAIVTNSALQLLMKQSPAAIDVVAKTFMLTKEERLLLLQCGVGEGIFFAGENRAAIKIVASYSEDQLITTDPRQLLEIEEAKKEFAESLKEKSTEA